MASLPAEVIEIDLHTIYNLYICIVFIFIFLIYYLFNFLPLFYYL